MTAQDAQRRGGEKDHVGGEQHGDAKRAVVHRYDSRGIRNIGSKALNLGSQRRVLGQIEQCGELR